MQVDFACPRCQVALARLPEARGVQWRCPSCEGRAVTIAVLRRIAEADYVNQVWRTVRSLPREPRGLPCALCRNPMNTVQHLAVDGDGSPGIDIDVCRACHTVWFDTHELPAILERVELPPEPPKPEFSPRAREIIALAEIERIRERADREDEIRGLPPADGWQTLLTVFGFPVEENAPALNRWPWVTWTTLALMTLATGWMLLFNPAAPREWGLVPTDPWRHGGVTFLTSFFLHAGLLHLVGNAVFLLIFGDNVEDHLGHVRFVLLLLGSMLVGDLLHLAFEPRGSLPSVGASGGISGVIAYYALQFPRVRLAHMFRFGPLVRWVRFSALTGFVAWLVLQGVGVWMQMIGQSNVSSLGHAGGALFGVVWYLAMRWSGRSGPATG